MDCRRSGKGMLTVARSAGGCRGHRPCDLGLSGQRQLDLGFFSRLANALDGHLAPTKVNARLLKFVEDVVEEGNIVKVFTAEVSVSVVDLTSKTPFCISRTEIPKVPLPRSYMARTEESAWSRPYAKAAAGSSLMTRRAKSNRHPWWLVVGHH